MCHHPSSIPSQEFAGQNASKVVIIIIIIIIIYRFV